MRIGNERRKYLADALSKTAEYTLSVVILGSIAAGKIRWDFLLGALAVYILFVVVGMMVTPEE